MAVVVVVVVMGPGGGNGKEAVVGPRSLEVGGSLAPALSLSKESSYHKMFGERTKYHSSFTILDNAELIEVRTKKNV